MKAPAFDYARPATFDEAFALFEEYGENARVIAGGQTLLATLNMRLSEPAVLVDLADIRGLRGISIQRDHVRIGALTRHSEIEDSLMVARHAPLLSQAAPHVAHRAIRNRGTIGGALAYADPAAEWPACALALDATFLLKSRAGERRIKADDFFIDLYTTALHPGELLIACEFPLGDATRRVHFDELVRRHGDYAIVGLAGRLDLCDAIIRNPRFAFMGTGTVPMLARKTAAALDGIALHDLDAALEQASLRLAEELQPIADLYNTAATKLHLARVLLRRAVRALCLPGKVCLSGSPGANDA